MLLLLVPVGWKTSPASDAAAEDDDAAEAEGEEGPAKDEDEDGSRGGPLKPSMDARGPTAQGKVISFDVSSIYVT